MTQSYSELIEKIDQDEVEEVNIRGTTLEMRLKERNENGDIVIKQDVSPYWMTSLLEHLENARVDHGLKYNYIQPTDMNAWISTIMSVLILLYLASSVYMFTRQGGRSKYNEFWQVALKCSKPAITFTFKDVAGLMKKSRTWEVVDF